MALFAAGTLIAQPTLEHPVWTENHHDYVAAQDLKVGDTFLDGKGAILRLDSLVVKPDTTLTVYNFEVENLHNYYVGTQQVLVHNTCVVNATLCQALSDLEARLVAERVDPLIAKQKIIALKNSFKGSNVSLTQRANLFNKIIELDLDKADFDRLITELSGTSVSTKLNSFLPNMQIKAPWMFGQLLKLGRIVWKCWNTWQRCG
ncbi:MAG: polymorphic toxin-type HINT domain-containing protein [Arcicella sp.]|nr:polymorphic toxin-type HINT domain-containing protein [Arcicella sp.]